MTGVELSTKQKESLAHFGSNGHDTDVALRFILADKTIAEGETNKVGSIEVSIVCHRSQPPILGLCL